MAGRYKHRKPTREEFTALMKRAGMNINDFIALTGRHAEEVIAFLTDAEPKKKEGSSRQVYVPRIGDVLILELAARDNELVETMIDIVNGYALPDPETEGSPPSRYWG